MFGHRWIQELHSRCQMIDDFDISTNVRPMQMSGDKIDHADIDRYSNQEVFALIDP